MKPMIPLCALAFTTIACPACRQQVEHIAFWKKIGSHNLFICVDCKKRQLTEEELFAVGFWTGCNHAKEKISETIHKMANSIVE